MKTGWITPLVFLLIGFVLARVLIGSEPPETIVLPSKPDTVVVTDTVLREIQDTIFRTRVAEVMTTDTVNLTDTVYVTALRPVERLDRLFMDSITVGREAGDATIVAGTRVVADSQGVARQDFLERFVTLGPLRSAIVDTTGFRLDFGEFPRKADSCGFFCQARIGVFGAALGFLVAVVVTP